MSLTSLLVAYILGGLTFIPLLLAGCVALLLKLSPEVSVTAAGPAGQPGLKQAGNKLDEATASIAKKDVSNTKVYRSGWLTVRRTFEVPSSGGSSSLVPPRHPSLATNTSPSQGQGHTQAPIQLQSQTQGPASDAASIHSSASASSTDSGYITSLASSYRSFMDARAKSSDTKARTKPRDKFFAVLKDSVLFLYENEQEQECAAAVKLPLHDVLLYPERLIDGELFMKRNAICLRPHVSAGAGDTGAELPSLIMTRNNPAINGSISASTSGTTSANATMTDTFETGGPQPWFLFPAINHDKEDWYHSLIQSSKYEHPSELARDASLFDADDMGRLVEAIDEQPDPIPTRWLNAMIGRLFFSVYRTSAVEDYIIRKLVRKLCKIHKPSFLSEIEVKEASVGATTPFFSKPMLKELTAEGDASMEMRVNYVGDFRITIATVATLNLGSRFKSYSVRLVLAVVLKELEGTLLFKIKRAPSNRVWFAFTGMPRLVLSVEPVVSTRQIKWSMITKPIESRLREVIAESIVLPHMDDIAFLNTKPYAQRGGIFGDCLRKQHDLATDAADAASSAGASTAHPPIEEDEAEEEGGTLAPGVPNLHLSDDKHATSPGPDAEGLRQRGGLVKKKSDSNLSTKSAPVPLVEKDKEHARKKSWFSSTTSASFKPGTTLQPAAAASDPALPLNSTSAKSTPGPAALATTADAARSGVHRKSAPPVPDSSLAHGPGETSDGAADRLREILESGGKTTSRKGSMSGTESSARHIRAGLDVPAAAAEEAVQAENAIDSPSQSEEAISQPAVSVATASQGTLRSQGEPFDIGSTYPSISEKPNLFRKKSDKSVTSVKTSSSTGSAGGISLSAIAAGQATGSSETLSSSTGGSSPTSTATASNLINSWRAKAADKQALQASMDKGVMQAKDTMNKWSSKWQAYKKAQADKTAAEQAAELGQGAESSVPPFQYHYHAPELTGDLYGRPAIVGSSPKLDQGSFRKPANPADSAPPAAPASSRTSEEMANRSRSGSTLSSSPSSHFFRPSAAVATTSLTTGEGISMTSPASGSTAKKSPERSPKLAPVLTAGSSTSPTPLKRVPPPSTVPVHPAFSTANTSNGQSSHTRRASMQPKPAYQPAAMMSIPGMEESRRVAISSEDLKRSESAKTEVPSLPARPGASTPSNIGGDTEALQHHSSSGTSSAPLVDEHPQSESILPSEPAAVEIPIPKPPLPPRDPQSEPSDPDQRVEIPGTAPALPTRPRNKSLGQSAPVPDSDIPVVSIEPSTPDAPDPRLGNGSDTGV